MSIVTIKVSEETRKALRYIAAVTESGQQETVDRLVLAEATRLGWRGIISMTGEHADAQQQLSPQWANASTLDRAVAAFNVITTCEGGN